MSWKKDACIRVALNISRTCFFFSFFFCRGEKLSDYPNFVSGVTSGTNRIRSPLKMRHKTRIRANNIAHGGYLKFDKTPLIHFTVFFAWVRKFLHRSIPHRCFSRVGENSIYYKLLSVVPFHNLPENFTRMWRERKDLSARSVAETRLRLCENEFQACPRWKLPFSRV